MDDYIYAKMNPKGLFFTIPFLCRNLYASYVSQLIIPHQNE